MVDAAAAALDLRVELLLEELVVELSIHQLRHQLKDLMAVMVLPMLQTMAVAAVAVLARSVVLLQDPPEKQVMVVLENNQV
tara:strand:+ start:216 stop:458 length:243 start_codon:yes stop_codon:yes gene_type:complete